MGSDIEYGCSRFENGWLHSKMSSHGQKWAVGVGSGVKTRGGARKQLEMARNTLERVVGLGNGW